MDKKPELLTFIGVGLYQISVGLLLTSFVSFLLGLPIIMAFPILHPSILLMVKMLGLFLFINGIAVATVPLLFDKYEIRSPIEKVNKCYILFNIGLTALLIPIGPFVSFTLYLKIRNGKQRIYNWLRFVLIFITGVLHIFIGVLLAIVLPSYLLGSIDLLFPYITLDLIAILRILGWISLVPGLILILSSFWAKKVLIINTVEEKSLLLRIIRKFMLISSVLIIIVFPFGTFFGLVVLLEIIKEKK